MSSLSNCSVTKVRFTSIIPLDVPCGLTASLKYFSAKRYDSTSLSLTFLCVWVCGGGCACVGVSVCVCATVNSVRYWLYKAASSDLATYVSAGWHSEGMAHTNTTDTYTQYRDNHRDIIVCGSSGCGPIERGNVRVCGGVCVCQQRGN